MFGRKKKQPSTAERIESLEAGYSHGWRHVMDARVATGGPFDYDVMTPTPDAAYRMMAGDEVFVQAFYMGALDASEHPEIETDRAAIANAFHARRVRDRRQRSNPDL